MFFVEGAPFCFKIELIEVRIFLHEVNDSGLNISLRVSERAILSVLALSEMFWEFCTEFSFVFFYVV
jgi:hypothetical protein